MPSTRTDEWKKPPFPFPAPPLSSALPHLLRSVTAGFSQSLAWLGWDAPSLPDAVGGSGREVIFFFFFFLVASGSTSVGDDSDDGDDDDDGGRAAVGKEETTLLASGFDRKRQKGVARDATRKESAGGASEVVLGRKKRRNLFVFFFLSTFDSRKGAGRSPVVHFFFISAFCSATVKRSQGATKRPFAKHPFALAFALSSVLFRVLVRTWTRSTASLPRCAVFSRVRRHGR